MSKVDEFLQEAIPSSFVYNRLKIKTDGGSGEAKLHIGSKARENFFVEFFNDYDLNNRYYFDRSNMIEFMKYLKLEYIYQSLNEYKDIGLDYYKEYITKINSLDNMEFEFELIPFSDRSRYYIRSNDNIFKDIFRRIALPLISNLRIEKHDISGSFEYKFLLEPNFNYSKNVGSKPDLEDLEFPKNRIVFGAPGTGKSYRLGLDKEVFGENFERVTFHPNYSYAQFVGTYKPTPIKGKNDDGEDIETITYKYVPGPFMRTYVKAIKGLEYMEPQSYLLLIEEINRANMAAVFGDVFQLLDRKDGKSEYEIETSEDIRTYLALELFNKDYSDCTDEEKQSCNKMEIPSNMYIWATMNSADQGVFPMDTAFKRRWDFEYIGINENSDGISNIIVKLGRGDKQVDVNWNKLRTAINNKLSKVHNVNEDKLLGPYFLSKEVIAVEEGTDFVKDNERFIDAFKSKVIMYLYEDAAKPDKHKVFEGCESSTYSSVCEAFEDIGIEIFGNDIKKIVLDEE